MILDTLTDEMKVAMKSGEKFRLGVIRMLRAELKNAQIAKGEELSEDAETKVLMSYAKKRKEAHEQALEVGRQDHADREKREYEITMSFLPPQMSEEEIAAVVRSAIDECRAQGMKDFGKVMKAVMQEIGGRAEGSVVSGVVKKVLTP